MDKEQKISKVVRKVSFAEAKAADDEYWSKTSAKERLKELERLRKLVWGNKVDGRIKKIVKKKSIYEKE